MSNLAKATINTLIVSHPRPPVNLLRMTNSYLTTNAHDSHVPGKLVQEESGLVVPTLSRSSFHLTRKIGLPGVGPV